MTQDTATTARMPEVSQRGITLVEVVIAAFLTAVILSMFYGSATSVSTMTLRNNREMRSETKQRDVLENVRAELEKSSVNGRFTVTVDGKSISYTKLIGASQNGTDVSGIWSETFTISRDSAGNVSRKSGPQTVSWGSGVEDLSFSYTSGDTYIMVTCVTVQNGANVGRTIQVHPRH